MSALSFTQKCNLNTLVSDFEMLAMQQQHKGTDPIYIRTADTDPFYEQKRTQPTAKEIESMQQKTTLLTNQKKLSVGDKRLLNRISRLKKLWNLPIATSTNRVPKNNLPSVLICCGPMASGKSYAARSLGGMLGYTYIETDIFHRQTSVDKMKTGVSITDEERQSYIDTMYQVITAFLEQDLPVVLAFPAHTVAVRSALTAQFVTLRFIRFSASEEELLRRAQNRKHPYIKQGVAELIPKQIAINAPLNAKELAQGHLEVPPEPQLSTGKLLRSITDHFRKK